MIAALLPALDAFLEAVERVQLARLKEDAAEDARRRALLLQARTAQQLADLAQRVADEADYSPEDLATDGRALLGKDYLAAFVIGAGVASQVGQDWAAKAAATQQDYLRGFGDDVASGKTGADAIAARANLYAGGTWTGYQRGQVDANPSGASYIWHAEGDGTTCDLCDARDGEEYTEDTLPGFPGEGDFGDICEGAANCRCWLELVSPEDQE